MENKPEYKNLPVSPETHREIKMEATRRGMSIKDFVAWLLGLAKKQDNA